MAVQKKSESKKSAGETIIDFYKDIVTYAMVIGIAIAIIGFCYLLIKSFQEIIPGQTKLAKDAVFAGLITFFIALGFMNIKEIAAGFKTLIVLIFNSIGKDGAGVGGLKIEKVRYAGDPLAPGLPPIKIIGELKEGQAKADAELSKKINTAFFELDLNVKVKKFTVGSAISKVWLEMEKSLRIKDVVALKDDIAMKLAVESVNILNTQEGMIMEVPNKERRMVTHREVMEKLRNTKLSELAIIIGEESTGEPYYFDVYKMTHILIAGATNMGKSVCLNTIIATLLLRKKPSELKFLLIDPKQVEFAIYKKLPHLIKPVVQGLEGGVQALEWCIIEMERRYSIMEKDAKKNLYQYPSDKRPFPVLIIVVDELADLILVSGEKINNAISRLAGKARAAGMHLILATQRPEAKIISGLIRANVPSRIALKTATEVDSRIILDQGGAEKLTGMGEMLVKIVGSHKAVRCQGSFIDDKDMENLVNWWSKNWDANSNQEVIAEEINSEPLNLPVVEDIDDELLDQDGNSNQESSNNMNEVEKMLRLSICSVVIENEDPEEVSYLPTIREIVAAYKVTIYRVKTILDQLEKEGWIEKENSSDNPKFSKTKIILDTESAKNWLKNMA